MKTCLLPLLYALLLLPMTLPAADIAPKIIAHRGASHDAPENTLAAARLAWEQRADGIECDVHLTRDGKLVVIHDPTLDRTTRLKGIVADMTLDEICEASLHAGTDKEIPTLEEWLVTGAKDALFFIEIKCGATALPELQRVLHRSRKKPDQIVLISFNAELLREAKRLMPQYAMVWILRYDRNAPTLESMIHTCKDAGLQGLDLQCTWPIDRAFVHAVHSAGLTLHFWTVDDGRTARRLAALGADTLTTNRPAFIRESLKRQPSP